MIDQTMPNISNEEKRYDFIVVGAGAAGSVLAAELSASGAQVLVIESGGPDDAPTIMNPSIWFYNVGGPLDYHLPVTPSPRLNNRKFGLDGARIATGDALEPQPVGGRQVLREPVVTGASKGVCHLKQIKLNRCRLYTTSGVITHPCS
jgi:choline dehydrogenase